MCDVKDGEKKCDVKLRGTNGVIQDKNFSEKGKLRNTQLDIPCHQPQDSLLSSSRAYTNYRGLLNLCILLLVLSSGLVFFENVEKYGILIDPLKWMKVFVGNPFRSPLVFIIVGLYIAACLSLEIEIALAKGIFPKKVGQALIILLLSAVVLLPSICVFTSDSNAAVASLVMTFACICFLKLISYHVVNYWCRDSQSITQESQHSASVERKQKPQNAEFTNGETNEKKQWVTYPDNLNFRDAEFTNGETNEKKQWVTYPDNLNFRDLFYFIWAPTLCYELNFPRSTHIRKGYLIKRIVETFLLTQFMLAVVQQCIEPLIYESVKLQQDMEYSRMIYILFKLSMPMFFVWLMWYYLYFHSILNTVAEILRFADRKFYGDWWNAIRFQYFWKNWNISVHKWCVRHMYLPLLRSGFSKVHAITVIFIVSAFVHEYIASISFKAFSIPYFMTMFVQLPCIVFVDKYLRNQYANLIVWTIFAVALPFHFLFSFSRAYCILSC